MKRNIYFRWLIILTLASSAYYGAPSASLSQLDMPTPDSGNSINYSEMRSREQNGNQAANVMKSNDALSVEFSGAFDRSLISQNNLSFMYPAGSDPTISFFPAYKGPYQYGTNVVKVGKHIGSDLLHVFDYKKHPDYFPSNATEATLRSNSVPILYIYSVAHGKTTLALDAAHGHGYGNVVVTKHLLTNGRYLFSLYGHMLNDSLLTAQGEYVSKGSKLGIMGNTGHSDYPHVHFEIKDSDGLGPYFGYIDSTEFINWEHEDPDKHGYHDPYFVYDQNNPTRVLLPFLSITNQNPDETHYDVYGVRNEPIYGSLNVAGNFYHAAILVRDTVDRATAENGESSSSTLINASLKYLVQAGNEGEHNILTAVNGVAGTRNSYQGGDYLILATVSDGGDAGNNLPGRRYGYPIKFCFLQDVQSLIVDNDQSAGSASIFVSSPPINLGADDQKIVPGYFLTSRLVKARSGAYAQWWPYRLGAYRIYVHIPRGNTASKLYYKIGSFVSRKTSKEIIPNPSQDGWYQLTADDNSTVFNLSWYDYVEIFLGKDVSTDNSDNTHLTEGDWVAFDAVKFEYVDPSCLGYHTSGQMPGDSLFDTCEPTTVTNVSPTSGTYHKGDPITVNWRATGQGVSAGDQVVIAMRRDSSSSSSPDNVNWYRLAESTVNTGTFSGVIPTTVAEASDWRIHVRHVSSGQVGKGNGNFQVIKSEDSTPPTGRVSGISSSYIKGNTVSYTVEGQDETNLAKLHFQVTDSSGSFKHDQLWNVSGTSASYSNSFSTSGWSPGTYYYTLFVQDAAGHVSPFHGQFQLTQVFRIDKSDTTSGGGTWGAILKMTASLSGTNLTLTVSKADGSAFTSSGTVYFKVGTYESSGENRYTLSVNSGDRSKAYYHDLTSYPGYPKGFYVRCENQGGYAWVGPINVSDE
ncbi:MAG: M23 family metallopeptidase [Deltaproteobacteria bacterium]|nr:M23 family metallopeptidase [Deltaproteobacteria bacterium]